MFKKPKQKKNGGANFRKRSVGMNKSNRRITTNDDSDNDDVKKELSGSRTSDNEEGETTTSTTELLSQLKQEQQQQRGSKKRLNQFGNNKEDRDRGTNTYNKRQALSNNDGGVSKDLAVAAELSAPLSAQEMATRGAEYHPETKPTNDVDSVKDTEETTVDGTKIYKGTKKVHNKFHAGPLKAPTFVRTTCRFDYQPDICKDYKETGFCGFGDTCIYLHDRGDTLTGWQLEQKYQEEKKQAELEKERQLNAFMDGMNQQEGKEKQTMAALTTNDGIPFKCWICRKAFDQPIVTMCGHYFCTKCIMYRYRDEGNSSCPVCQADTGGVFNDPTKLYQKVRRTVGRDGTLEDYANAFTSTSDT